LRNWVTSPCGERFLLSVVSGRALAKLALWQYLQSRLQPANPRASVFVAGRKWKKGPFSMASERISQGLA